MESTTRPLHLVAAVAAAVVTVALLVDDDGSIAAAIVFGVVALTWLFAPGLVDRGRPGRASVDRIAAVMSIAASAVLFVALLLA